jgi:hypothetical protein
MIKSTIDHLPEKKQRELARVVEILHAEFEDALALSSSEWKKNGPYPDDHSFRLLCPR